MTFRCLTDKLGVPGDSSAVVGFGADDKTTQIKISMCVMRGFPQLRRIGERRRKETHSTLLSGWLVLTISPAAINLCGERAMVALLTELLTQVQNVFLGPTGKVLSLFGSTSTSLLRCLSLCRGLCGEEGGGEAGQQGYRCESNCSRCTE